MIGDEGFAVMDSDGPCLCEGKDTSYSTENTSFQRPDFQRTSCTSHT